MSPFPAWVSIVAAGSAFLQLIVVALLHLLSQDINKLYQLVIGD